MDGAQAERPERELVESLLGEGAIELERRSRPRAPSEGRQQADRLLAQASKRDLEHAGRGRVEPLHIVEGDEHGASLGQSAQHIEHGQPDRVRIGSHVARLGQEQRDLERPPPRRHERGRRLLEDGSEQLREPGERE